MFLFHLQNAVYLFCSGEFCVNDIMQNCPNLNPKPGEVITCLAYALLNIRIHHYHCKSYEIVIFFSRNAQNSGSTLSDDCMEAVFSAQLAAALRFTVDPLLKDNCIQDAERLCEGVPDGGGQIQHCLVRESRVCSLMLGYPAS